MSAAKLAAPCVFVELGLAGAVLVMGWSGVEGVRVLPLPCSPNCALGCPPPMAPRGQLFGPGSHRGQVSRCVLRTLSLPAGL